jgi:ferric-dicitrate binding protein FerR (iron transport regulator)
VSFKNNVQPGGNKALLTLADGSIIALDNSPNGALAQQGNTKILKLNGKLAYENLKLSPRKILYNTISTPRGGQYQIILPDGTAVWLNAATYMRFPTAFTGKERRVEISGEAYFEVATNKAMPFIVSVNGSAIKVFGTHFNVMAYTDEPVLKTTLFEGSVEFYNSGMSAALKPGQQAELNSHGQIRVINDADIQEIMAWKNGYFYFERANIETVMRQIARWYNIDVVYQNRKTADLFHADIPRNTSLSEVLKALEIAGGVKFKLEGHTITVI